MCYVRAENSGQARKFWTSVSSFFTASHVKTGLALSAFGLSLYLITRPSVSLSGTGSVRDTIHFN